MNNSFISNAIIANDNNCFQVAIKMVHQRHCNLVVNINMDINNISLSHFIVIDIDNLLNTKKVQRSVSLKLEIRKSYRNVNVICFHCIVDKFLQDLDLLTEFFGKFPVVNKISR